MTRRQALLPTLAVAFVLSACSLAAPTGTQSTAGGKKTTTTATGGKTTVNTTGKAASPTPEPITGMALSGIVQVDAHYVIAAGGGNVVAAGGGNVIAAGGGNVVAAGGGNYRVAATTDVPVGTILPAKGMQVQAINMSTGAPFGKPVTTDEKGAFKLGVPKDQEDNVLLIASFPGSKDPRLTYPLVVSPTDTTDHAVDEDTALVTKYLRQCLVGRVADVMALPATADPVDAIMSGGDSNKIPDFLKSSAKAVLARLQAAATAKSVNSASLEVRSRYAQRIADALLAKVDLEAMKGSDNKENAVEAMVDIMRKERTAAEAKMKEDPDFFTKHQEFTNTEVYKDGIKRPSDLGQFLCTEYLGRAGMQSFERLDTIHQLIGVDATQANRAKIAATGVAQGLVLILLSNPDAQDAAVKSFDQP